MDLDDAGIEDVAVGVTRIHALMLFGVDDGDRQIAIAYGSVEA